MTTSTVTLPDGIMTDVNNTDKPDEPVHAPMLTSLQKPMTLRIYINMLKNVYKKWKTKKMRGTKRIKIQNKINFNVKDLFKNDKINIKEREIE